MADLQAKIVKLISKPVLAGVSAGLIGLVLMNSAGKTMTIAGFGVPAYLAQFGVVTGASFLSDVVADFILPHLNADERATRIEGQILQPALTGLALVGLDLAIGTMDSSIMLRAFALGATSEFAGTAGYSIFKDVVLPH